MRTLLLLFGLITLTVSSVAQKASNSVLVNFGRQLCSSSTSGSDITLIDAAHSSTPGLLLQCNTTAPIGDVYSKFISYNSVSNKLFLNNISDGANSDLYSLSLGIPSNVTAPVITGVSYTIAGVVLSQFEFDPLGDLYALSGYNVTLGSANIGAYDDTSGMLQSGSLKTLYFPSGYFPSDVDNGDVAILPNGRMFCVFGGEASKFFEITNYKKTDVGNAVAIFLGSPAKVCYGLAFDNGFLLMGGNTDGSCYSFTYDLTNSVLSAEIATPVNSMPIDYASFTPSLGAGLKIVSAVWIDPTHYDLTYNAYLKNLGNVRISDIKATLNLSTTFDAANISNVTTSFISNGAVLALNPSFNGSTDINLLNLNQTLNNYPVAQTSSIIQITLRVANSVPLHIYYNTVIFSGRIGLDSTLLLISDSSNNFTGFPSWAAVTDPNTNSVADDPAEGLRTPWWIDMVLPIELSTFDVQPENAGAALSWTTLSEKDNAYFAIERSNDAIRFDSIGIVSGSGTSTVMNDYSFFDTKLPNGTIYYRLRQMDANGSFTFSEIRVLELNSDATYEITKYLVYPNPATDYLVFESSKISKNDLNVNLYNVSGTSVFNMSIPGTTLREQIVLPQAPNGFYILAITNPDGAAQFFKIAINN